MAQIVMGIGSSHAPQLNTPAENWEQRAAADRRNPALAFRGADYAFDDLVEHRGGGFADQLGPDVYRDRLARCRAAIDRLGEAVRSAEVDVLVVVSSDHKETFNDEVLAPFTVYWGETMQHEPYTQEALDAMAPGLAIAEVANVPEVSTTRQGHPGLGLHLIKGTQAAGFDPAASQRLPAGKHGDHGIPHGWGFIIQQVLENADVPPIVPIFVNTFWHPNPPSARRCYEFGKALGAAIADYPEDIRVGVVASGGLSHFVIDEELDRRFLAALESGDEDFLSGIPDDVLRAGTSEMRNWIVVAGATADTELSAEVVDYVPCYRSEAGTGCGMGSVAWLPTKLEGDVA